MSAAADRTQPRGCTLAGLGEEAAPGAVLNSMGGDSEVAGSSNLHSSCMTIQPCSPMLVASFYMPKRPQVCMISLFAVPHTNVERYIHNLRDVFSQESPYRLPQQALYDFLVAGHLVLRPTR